MSTRRAPYLVPAKQLPALDALAISSPAPRGYRLPHDAVAFHETRKERLTASLLPRWLGLGSQSMSREKIVRILNANDGAFELPINDFVAPALDWGVEHEPKALLLYQELTRLPVALGSTRRRGAVAGETVHNENRDFAQPGILEPVWEWQELLAATPDGFVIDQNIGGGVGLLEIKCPFALKPDLNGIPARHNADLPLYIEAMGDNRTHALFLQAWAQLEVVRDATFIDLCVYKMAPNVPGRRPREFLWLARLARNRTHQNRLKGLLKGSFNAFASALEAIRLDEELGSNPTHRGAPERPVRARAVQLSQSKEAEWEPEKLTRAERAAIRTQLDHWAQDCLRFRDAGDARGGFPWRTKFEVERERRNPDVDLVRRYDVAGHEVHAIVNGAYKRCELDGKILTPQMLWATEHFA